MRFSVLLSVFNKEIPDYLEKAIESVINQTLIPNEIVIVKDGVLTNELDDVIDTFMGKYPGLFKIICLKKNVGLGKALEIGVMECSFEIIARMDSDDICLPNRFEKQINKFKEDSTIDVLGAWIAEFDKEPTKLTSIRKVPLNYEEIQTKAKYRNPLNHMSVVFKKSSVISAGNYRPFLLNEDYYLWVRMLLNSSNIINIPDVLLYVRRGENLFKRRGGIRYLVAEIKLQKEFLNMGFTTHYQFFYNIFIRSIMRILPNKLRSALYKKILRTEYINKDL